MNGSEEEVDALRVRLEARQARAKAEKKAKSEAKRKLKAEVQDSEVPSESVPSQSSTASVSTGLMGNLSSETSKLPSGSKLMPSGAAGSSKIASKIGGASSSKSLPGMAVNYIYDVVHVVF